MPTTLEALREILKQAELDRKRGDALRKAKREPEAVLAYQSGISTLEGGLALLDGADWQHQPEFVPQRSEILGSLGGLLRRLARDGEAYRRYAEGGKVEHDFELPTTYTRVNEIKYALLTGATTIAALQERARQSEKLLATTLNSPKTQQLADDGWAWADLGDCRGLLGDYAGASSAYTTFISKAGVSAPATTLDVLGRIAE